MVTSEGFQGLDGTPSASVTIQSLHQGQGEMQKWTYEGGSSCLMWHNARHPVFWSPSLSSVPLGPAKPERYIVTASQKFAQYFFF